MQVKQAHWKLMACLVVLVSLGASLYGTKQIIGKRDNLDLARTVHVGDLTLEAGIYQVQHMVSDSGNHFVVFRPRRRDQQTSQAACIVEPLPKKVKRTEYHVSAGNLLELRIKGEMVRHIFLADRVTH